jgi:hypothetical protein
MAQRVFSFRVQRLLLSLSIWVAVFVMSLFDHPPMLWRCGFHEITGLPCPSCGMTRALFAAANGRFKEAFAFHPLGLLLFVFGIALSLVFALEAVMNRKLLTYDGRVVRILLILFLALMLLLWVVRLCIIFGLRLPIPIYGAV